MTKIFAVLGLGFGFLITAACDDATAQGKPSPTDTSRQHLPALKSATVRPPSAQIAPASEEKTCSKFLPNVGLVMTVPCSDQQLDIVPVAAATPPPMALSPAPRPTTIAPQKASHKVSQQTCSEILQRIQLDDARDDDQERLRKGC